MSSNKKNKRVKDLAAAPARPQGVDFAQLVGTGITPEGASAAIEAVTGYRIPAGIVLLGMREAMNGMGIEEYRADTLATLQRSGFPVIERVPPTLLAQLILNKEMRGAD